MDEPETVWAGTLARRLALFPDTARIAAGPTGEALTVAGCDLAALADRYGTPLYLYDRATMDAAVDAYRAALSACYPGSWGLTYASKAFLCTAIAQWTARADLWLDCTGVGELAIAAAAGLSRERILVHGVNKSPDDLEAALAQAGIIVVDNLVELTRLVARARQAGGILPDLWLRFRPGLAVDTHSHTQTGQEESKFGMDGAETLQAISLCRQEGLPLNGLHFHQGSHFRDVAPLSVAVDKALDLMAAAGVEPGWIFSPGGGWAVAYHEDELPQPEIAVYVQRIAADVVAGCQRRGLPLPRLQLEPGRSLIARAGVALYRVGAIKQSARRRWVLLDGGLTDNPRPALYGARYSALPVQGPLRPPAGPAWLAGPHCESGDVLINDLPLASLRPGDVVAVPVSGAYQLSMASNYNGARRPAVLWLEQGRARLIQAREPLATLLRRDRRLWPVAAQPGQGRQMGNVRFHKFQGLGNGYLVIHPVDVTGDLTPVQVRRICDLSYGAGSDGIVLGPLPDPDCEFAVRFFNPDGSEFEKSGNGLRIFARYLWDEGLVQEEPFSINTPGGRVTARVHPGGRMVTVEMGTVSFDSRRIPVAGLPREVLDETIVVDGQELRYCAATIGNAHCVVLCDEVSAGDARRWGPLLEKEPRFPNRTNVQFMKVLDRANIRIEIWERGAGYTLASGSSSCAAAAVAHRLGLCDARLKVHMPGGQLNISISPEYAISMTGAVAKVYEGTLSAEVWQGS
jgi:diaminopimelate decarboxylase/diaminopimelate epimerase